MIKKTYNIHGFDCANCASKAEKHLSKHPNIASCTLDFAGDKLFLTYKDKELSVEEIKKVIKEVETDEITITPINKKVNKKLIDKDFIFLSIRILLVVICMILAHTVLLPYFWGVFSLYLFSLLLLSYDIYYKVINHIIHLENPLDEYLLISLASIGAFIIASISKDAMAFMESTLVVLLFQIGQVIESIATNKSKSSINNALDLRSEYANKIEKEDIVKVSPEELKIGDKILITSGEKIPTDGVVIKGEGYLDTSSLTGEFVPLHVKENENVCSGTVLKEGTLTLEVSKAYEDSTVYKLIELISHSGERKSKADKFVSKFAKFYTPIIFIISILVAIIGGAITSNWNQYIILGLKMLVVACPCAIVISIPLAYFSALGLASKNGILIKGTNYLDRLNELKKVYTDKTGTLTKGTFSIREVVPFNSSKEELLEALNIVESLSTHPIAKAINSSSNINKNDIKDFQEYPGLGVSCTYNNEKIIAGNLTLLEKENIKVSECLNSGVVIYVSNNNKFLGYVTLGDEIKQDAKELIDKLKELKIQTILLSGDKDSNVKEIANKLGIDEYHSNLSPSQKAEIIEENKSSKYSIAYIGDGINDAATIKSSDVGFAMGGIGSDIAVNNADIVIMNDDITKVYDSYQIAKKARHTSIFNIVVAISVKIAIELAAIISSLLGRGEVIPMWGAILADTGLTVLLVFNSLLLLYRKVNKKSVK